MTGVEIQDPFNQLKSNGFGGLMEKSLHQPVAKNIANRLSALMYAGWVTTSKAL